ncbi:hypothetical protein [Neisseria lactamica]|uniref:hypothetical protein n=1 Tax=Neisseria lactamica TaxID=486 RepID=UPI001864F7BA|nr:hypothetical protein [Neisseria lactamica]
MANKAYWFILAATRDSDGIALFFHCQWAVGWASAHQFTISTNPAVSTQTDKCTPASEGIGKPRVGADRNVRLTWFPKWRDWRGRWELVGLIGWREWWAEAHPTAHPTMHPRRPALCLVLQYDI